MYLSFRRAIPSDFEPGYALASHRYGYKDDLKKDMFKLWKALLESGHDPMAVVEDRDRPAGQRVVAFGVSFFAYDWFVQEAKTAFPPRVDLCMFKQWKTGKRPFLLKNEIIEDQLKDGLNAVAFTWGWDIRNYGPEDSLKIAQTQSQSYIAIVSRYRLKRFVQEVKGDWERDRLMNYGIDLWKDYSEFSGTRSLTGIPAEERPYLMGVVMEDVRKDIMKAGTAADLLARLGPPRYGFHLNEQEVLKRALQGETDEKIARSLHLTLITVKRRWQSIYGKVTDVDAGFFEEAAGPELPEKGGSQQRRRFLLKALGDHPEELWPNHPTKERRR